MPFDAQKFLILMKYYLSIFFIAYAFGVMSEESLPNPMPCRFPPMFSSKSLIVLPHMFMPLIHFELIFVYDVR